MKTNHQLVVEQEMNMRLADAPKGAKRSRVFDELACDVALRHFDLTEDEISSGIVDGGGDGGIDGAYVFVDQELLDDESLVLTDDFSASPSYRGASISLWLVQAKEEQTFKSGTVVTLNDSLKSLLDVELTRDDLAGEYSAVLLDKIFYFRDAIGALTLSHPHVSVNFVYVTIGDTHAVNEKVTKKFGEFRTLVEKSVGFEASTTTLIGAKGIWEALKHVPSYGSELRVTDSFAHETDAGDQSYVCLVSLGDYLAFLTDTTDGSYKDYLFDGNVRHHEGSRASVNREINATLADAESPEFWWLNNGVTVICSEASSKGKTFALDNVQVVNGLQTSRTIFDALRDVDDDDPTLGKHVLVRIIETDDPKTVNQIIRATNRQTPVKEESLRATDEVQLLIEQHLLGHDLYYDRRRNYYKNIGKLRSRIVSVRALTQALLAVAYSKPDDARARPGDYLKNDLQYSNVFNEHSSLAIYPWVLECQAIVDSELSAMEDIDLSEKNDARFLVSADIIARLLGYRPSAAEHVLSLSRDESDEEVPVGSIVTSAQVGATMADLRVAFETEVLGGGRRDRLAKSSAFATQFLKRSAKSLPAVDGA
jgi:hypothetical protein